MIVAGLLRHLALDQIAGGLKVEHENLGLQQRGLDCLSLAGFFPLQQRDQNAQRREQASAEIGDRNTDAERPLPSRTGDRHQPAHALRNLVEAGPVGVRPALAEAGNAGINQTRINPRQGL